MATEVIKLTFDSFSGEEEIIIPLIENLDDENIEYEEDNLQPAFEVLQEKWTRLDWGFHGKVIKMVRTQAYSESEIKLLNKQIRIAFKGRRIPKPEITTLERPTEIAKCSEFDISIFVELSHNPQHYSRPFDDAPDGRLFSSCFAVDCCRGEIYSKDFNYFDCAECNRTICEQNPSNGWHVQYRYLYDTDECSEGQVCLKCFEQLMFEEGVDLEYVLEHKQLQGMFFNTAELAEKDFLPVDGFYNCEIGMGKVHTTDPDDFFNRLAAKKEGLKDKIVIINYDSMAIGGLGGYVTIYAKDKPTK